MEEIRIGEELTTAQKIAAVNKEWINFMMLDYGIKNPRQLSIKANISEASLNRCLKGHREASSEIKNSLWWFFAAMAAEKQDKNFQK